MTNSNSASHKPIKDFFDEAEVKTNSIEIGDMSISEYQEQLGRLFYVDHHGHLRLTQGGPILAVNQKQVDAMINALRGLRPEVSSK